MQADGASRVLDAFEGIDGEGRDRLLGHFDGKWVHAEQRLLDGCLSRRLRSLEAL